MNKIIVLIACLHFLSALTAFSQDKKTENGNSLFSYEISNSAGFSFGETKPVFYINILKSINPKFSIGIRAGIYSFREKIGNRLQDVFLPFYRKLSPGQYEAVYDNLKVMGFTYVVSLSGKYKISNSFSAGISAGIKNYMDNGYNTTFTFAKVDNNYPLIINLKNASESGNDKNITRLYYSLRADYTINRFVVGLYGDNIYSIGLNFGLLF